MHPGAALSELLRRSSTYGSGACGLASCEDGKVSLLSLHRGGVELSSVLPEAEAVRLLDLKGEALLPDDEFGSVPAVRSSTLTSCWRKTHSSMHASLSPCGKLV